MGANARVVIVQFGSYAAGARRLAAGGPETFYAQRYSIDVVADLATQVRGIWVVGLGADEPEEQLPSGVRSLGIELYPRGRAPRRRALIAALERLRPDHLVLASPILSVLAWARLRRVRTLPIFADSFRASGLRSRLRYVLLARALRGPHIEWISNHNLAASLDLARIGVDRRKILPFDWPALLSPADRPAKTLRRGTSFDVIYVGQISEAKGVGDLLRAMRLLADDPSAPAVRLTIVGGDDGSFAERARALDLGDRVRFAGRIPHERVVPLMNEHDAVVVASRHEYPEGLPMTIYEAFCSRTPIVASDHPMFGFQIRDGESALVYPAGDARALADRLKQLAGDPTLYANLSLAAESAAADFFCPLKQHELFGRWLSGTEEDRRFLAGFSLASGRYDARLARAVRTP